MKALLYKDFLVLTKQMKFFLIMVAIFCLIPNDLDMGSFFVVYAGLFLPVSLLAYDERARWDTLAAMLPYTTRDLVLSRYVMGWCCLAFATVFWLVGQTIFPSGRGAMLLESLLVVVMTLILMALAFPVFFRLGTEKARLYLVLGCMILGCLLAGGGVLVVDYLLPLLDLSVYLLLPIFLVIAVAATAFSVKVSMKQYEARQW